MDSSDYPIHNWYRFVLAFPPHLVRQCIREFNLDKASTVLDPFCGTGTTLVESKLARIPGVGVEANPIAHFATRVKLDWSIDPVRLSDNSEDIAQKALRQISATGFDDTTLRRGEFDIQALRKLRSEQMKLLIKDSISAIPLHKTLILVDVINGNDRRELVNHQLLALAKAIVYSISNLRFGPEVGVGKIKEDTSVVNAWIKEVHNVVRDLTRLRPGEYPMATVYNVDSRSTSKVVSPKSIDAVITSPPYPNEKDYTRTTRLESVILGFIRDKDELRRMKRTLIRSNTRGVYKDDDDDCLIRENRRIEGIADRIEKRRLELRKTSGFERLYPRVTKLYFGGMKRHLSDLRSVLRPGARLAYVVGDQASYLQVMIRTGQILADIATELGYEVEGIELFRLRAATSTKSELREEVVRFRWPG